MGKKKEQRRPVVDKYKPSNSCCLTRREGRNWMGDQAVFP
jgi:hypothetical protein